MKALQVSAPGKLVVLGEYAVLFGATALVLAVDRRAVVRLGRSSHGAWELVAPQVLDQALAFRLEPSGDVHWHSDDPALPGRLELVGQVFRGLGESGRLAGARPARIEIDTAAFFETATPGARKFGLGSSAALTVALASALAHAAGHDVQAQPAQWLDELLVLHRRFQHGQGSGLDVAASLYGGLIAYRMPHGQEGASVTPVAWPEGLHALCVWSGESASTPAFLRQLERWRGEAPEAFARAMETLRRLADEAAALLAGGAVADWLDVARAYTEALQVFGEQAKISVFTAVHHRIGALARACGALYKPCGAGGGDIGMAMAASADTLARVRREVESAGFLTVPLARDPHGLLVDTGD